MANLYDISDEIDRLVAECIDEETGEIIDTVLAEALDELEAKREKKLLDLACYVVDMEAEAEKIHARERELAQRRKSLERRAERVKQYMRDNMEAGVEKLSDDRVSIGWRKSEGCVVDVKPENLPKRFQRWTLEADVATLRDALKAGDAEAAKVARLEQRQSLQVK